MANTTMGHNEMELDGAPISTNSNNLQEIQLEEEEKKEDLKQSTVPFHKLFVFADLKDVVLMVFGTVGAIANGMSWPLTAIILGNMIDAFGGAASKHDVIKRVSKVTLQFVYLAVSLAIGSTLQVSCWMATGERQAARIRNLYLKAILRQEIAFFDKYTKTGEIIGRMSGDTVLIQDAIGEKVGRFIQQITGFCGGMVVAFAKGWQLASLMLLTVPPLILSTTITHSTIMKMASLGQAAYADAATVVDQTLGSIRTVASFTGETQVVDKYKQSLRNAYKSGVQEGLMAGLGRGSVVVSVYVAQAFGTWYGSKLILRHGYTGAQVINILFALVSSCGELGNGLPCLTSFAAGQAAAFKMFDTINRKPHIDSCSMEGTKLQDIRGEIEFLEVHFSYPTRPQEKILKGISLSIPSGTTAAIVGESGSGKSTLIALIERFYDPQEGKVLIDGVDLKDFQLKWVRGKIGLVSQEPVLFTGTIRDNIAYGSDSASDEDIRSAAELANAANFIDKMPKKFETLVGEHGTQLSGGEKQRIAIARAILKDPRILLLDEATSALDIESERMVQEALDRVMVNRTTVVVAHRLSTVRSADMIVLLHHGSILEKGPHSELVKDPKGAYNRLIHLQETSYRELESYARLGNTRTSHIRNMSHENHNHFSSSLMEPPVVTISKDNISKYTSNKSAQEISISRLAALNKPEIPFLIIGCLASIVVGGVVFPIFGIILSSSVGTFYKPPHELRTQSNFLSCMYLIFAIVSAIADPVSSYSFAVAGSRLIRRVRLMTFEKVVNMEMSWFDNPENSSGAIGARLSANAAKVKGLLGDALAVTLQNSATMVAGLLIAYVSNWELALIASVMMPLVWINGTIQMKFIQGFSTDSKIMYESASQVASAAVSNIRTVASFSAEEKVEQLYQKKCDGPLRAGIKLGIISGVGLGVSNFILNCIFATIFYAGAHLLKDGSTTLSVVFRIYMALSAMKETQARSLAADKAKAKSAVAAVFATLDQKSRIDPSDTSGQTMNAVRGDIEFQHVTFSYPSRPQMMILCDFSLSINAGQTVALVGESGSGKSTAIALLQRFYDPDSGHILLDGIEIKKLQVRWLRQQMGLVSQEPILFNDTIRANIAYGKGGNATESEIVAAAKLANVHKFISSLPQGYDTTVGERGVQLSGGQKQRVAIARAILKEPKILLLDEATSALDAESERVVQDALDHLMRHRTSLVVAHRLSTIRNADSIAVVKDGMIVEKGNHDTLISVKDGVYASLITLHSSI